MNIKNNIVEIKQQIQNTNAVIVAVCKKQSIDSIEEAINCGITDFAENYVQEALSKWKILKNKYPHIKLHLIGKLQSNKVKTALEIFDYIHTIDSISLLNKIHTINKSNNTKFLIQVNLTNNLDDRNGASISELLSLINHAKTLNINIIGVMTVLPQDIIADSGFSTMLSLKEQYKIKELSMGMSGDYKEAIKYGATMIRLGTSIFGKRD